MTPDILVAASANIVGLLGLAHLIFTFWGPKLLPRDAALKDAMDGVTLFITRQTTVWRAWIGFNASHSMGLLFFGLTYGYLAIAHPDFLFQSTFLQGVGVAMLTGYVVLAKRFWFITPLIGASLSWVLFVLGVILARTG